MSIWISYNEYTDENNHAYYNVSFININQEFM